MFIFIIKNKEIVMKKEKVEKMDQLGYNKNVKNKCCKHQGGTKT